MTWRLLERAPRLEDHLTRFLTACLGTGALVIGLRASLDWIRGSGVLTDISWLTAQYRVSYLEYGFIKRGLIGTILSPLPSSSFLIVAVAVSLGGIAVFAVLLWALVREGFENASVEQQRGLLLLVCLSPLGVMNLAWDVGRFDVLNLALLTGGVLLLLRGVGVWTLPIIILAALIHEAFLVYGSPLLITLAYEKGRRGTAMALVAVSVLCGLALLVWGGSASVAEDFAGVGGRAWIRDFAEPAWALSPASYTVRLVYLGAIYGGLAAAHLRNRWVPNSMLLAALAPLSLFALGVDYGRWTTILFFAVVFILVARVRTSDSGTRTLRLATGRGDLLWLVPLALPIMGPVGGLDVFPLLRKLFQLLS